MQAYGFDRVRPGEGEQFILSSRFDKGWTARMPKTLTSAEFPGTAVLWDDRYFEVASLEALPQGGVRYVLEPWREHLTMRVTDRYDVESEANRIAEFRKKLFRERGRKSANTAALLTGHLPAAVQEELGSELGVLPNRLTVISIAGEYAVMATIVLICIDRYMRDESLPAALVIGAVFLAAEGTLRFLVSWTQSRAIGSVAGWIAYAVYYGITRRGPSPFAVPKGMKVSISSPPAGIAARDAILMREPLLTLLTPGEQARAAERFGYDYRRDSAGVAITILIASAVGAAGSLAMNALISSAAAAALALEQIVRLAAFRRGPAGSVLRFVVRPFVRKLVA